MLKRSRKRAIWLVIFTLAAVVALVAFAPSNQAFDVKRTEEQLAAKTLGFPVLQPNYNQAQVDLYLTQPIWQIWNQSNGGKWTAQFDTLTGKPRRVLGGSIPWVPGPANSLSGSYSAELLEQRARDFIATNQSIIAASNDRLRFVSEVANPTTDGHMRYAAFDYVIDGIPVEGARLIFAVNNGNLIYWHSSNIASVPTITTPYISADQATSVLLAYVGVTTGAISVVEPATLRLVPRNTSVGGLLAYELVYETAFRVSGSLATWAGAVDAITGTVVAFGDVNRYQAPRGSATGRVTGGIRPAKSNDAEVVRSFPFAQVDTEKGRIATSINGIFPYTGGTVSTGLNGEYFDANCADCIKSQEDPVEDWQAFVSSFGNGRLDLGTGGLDVQTPGENTKSYGNGTSTPAERTAFYHTNVARLMAKKWLNLEWLNNSNIRVNVNINDTCNAFWDGSSLNFFKAGVNGTLICANTGEIRDVMQHEWGHGLDSNDGRPPGYAFALGLGDLATGEGVGDHIALFVDHDSCIGQSFFNRLSGPFLVDPDTFEITQCDGVRNLDELRNTRGNLNIPNVLQQCPLPSTGNPLYFGPMLREGHCEGEIYGQFGYHLVQDLINGTKYGTVQVDANKQFVTYKGDPLPNSGLLNDGPPNPAIDRDLAWATHERIFFQSRPLVGAYASSRNQAIGPSVYDAYIVTDDEGDGLLNGTPNAAYINDAAVHHGIEEWGAPGGRPSAIDARNCDVLATPKVNLSQSIDSSTGTPAVTVNWSSVSGASSYTVFRSERRHDVFLELGKVTGNSFVDVGIDNGVKYNYRVQANGSGTCFTASGAGLATITIRQPEIQVSSVLVTDKPGGNGDGGLDAGESAQLFIVLENNGPINLTNVTATLSSITTGVNVTRAFTQSFGTIASGTSAGSKKTYVISLDPLGSLCGQSANFILSISSDQAQLVDSVSLTIGNDGTSCVVYKNTWAQPTSVQITSDKMNPSCGDGDLIPDPGETISVRVTANNTGTQTAQSVVISMASDKPYLTFVGPSSVDVGTLAPQGTETKSATFSISVGRGATFNDLATLTASVIASGQQALNQMSTQTRINRDKVLSDSNFDFETGAQGWTASDPTSGWTLSTAPQTSDLTQLWYSRYTAGSCTYLVSPSFEFSSQSKFSFDVAWVSEGSDANYDGADVQISVDGGKTWQTILPDEGYPALSFGDTCVPADNPFYSGYSPLMSRFNFNLSNYAGFTGQIRFRWAVDGAVEVPNGGVWVDNVRASRIVVAGPSATCL
jgi:Zn-dependent metalloprotease